MPLCYQVFHFVINYAILLSTMPRAAANLRAVAFYASRNIAAILPPPPPPWIVIRPRVPNGGYLGLKELTPTPSPTPDFFLSFSLSGPLPFLTPTSFLSPLLERSNVMKQRYKWRVLEYMQDNALLGPQHRLFR